MTIGDNSQPKSSSPLPPGYRASGVLLHVTSLPSPYGIGDLGPAALAWIDRLQEAGQSWWQALPLGPTGYGNSPYQSESSFAGNWLLISPDGLIADGLLRPGEAADRNFSQTAVDYEAVIALKQQLLKTVWTNFSARAGRELKLAFEQFRNDQAHWLEDYALFRALQGAHQGACYLDWPAELVQRNPAALAAARRDLANPVDETCLAQFLVFRQAEALKKHAHAKGIRLIGDLPFYVSPDSSDVWADPELFLLDKQHRPRFVGGVPPDYFSSEGQLWGNPVYDWEALRRTGYRWCIDRMRALLAHVDLIRLDHFRGFAAAWHVPAGRRQPSRANGCPAQAPNSLRRSRETSEVCRSSRKTWGSSRPTCAHCGTSSKSPGHASCSLPSMADLITRTFPATTSPTRWCIPAPMTTTPRAAGSKICRTASAQNFWHYLKRPPADNSEAAPELMRVAWSSVAMLAIVPLQDLLNLGTDARMNVPGSVAGNWRWRATEEMLVAPAFRWLRDLTNSSDRSPAGRLPLPIQ